MEEIQTQQPSAEAQQVYMELISNEPTEVEILRTNKKYKVRWLKNGQLEALSKLLIGKSKVETNVLETIIEDSRIACKAAAIILLDGYWKLKFNYWWLWRWFYYIKQYDNIQLDPILETGKKKVPQMQFFRSIMLLTEAKDSLMRMTAKEVEATLRELNTAQPLQTEKKDSGS